MSSLSQAELRTQFTEYLRDEKNDYVDKIVRSCSLFQNARTGSSSSSNNLASQGGPRVIVNLNDLRGLDSSLVNRMMATPVPYLIALEAAANEIAASESTDYTKLKNDGITLRIGFEGSFGSNHVSPRGLLSSCLRRLVCVEGIVTKCSTVRPKIVQSVHYCPATGETQQRVYRDSTALELGMPEIDDNGMEIPDRIQDITNNVYPTKDKDSNPLEMEYGLSKYKDHQTVTIQEMPERAPMGQLPRSVDIILDNDLVDQVKPGDRVQAMGVFRALSTSATAQCSGVFKTVVLANNVKVLGGDASQLEINADDIRNIKALGKRSDILDILGRSVSPSIYGHEYIKKALALQLLGGCEKNLDNGTHLRGDINILMVGDPSTAKSQLLRSALHLAPLAISTTGRGSSGVGLTAAVTSDPDTKDRRLEAGAMVLADRGMVCIDEFDKMSEADRVAIHEVMEQQTVTIAKAGIHASLNARCSVLAAANPVYGQYDKTRRPQENIGLPDSLLSRFDLLFIVLDQMDPENDRKIAGHVLRGHRYRREGTDMEPEPLGGQQGDSDEDEEEEEEEKRKIIWQKAHSGGNNSYTSVKNAGSGGGVGEDDHEGDVLCQDFLRKYIFYAKTKNPTLTEPAREYIATRYSEMRSKQDNKTLPVTARSLETIIRLSSAMAKARLSTEVSLEDCKEAMDVLSFALYHEEDPSKKRKRVDDKENAGDQSNKNGNSDLSKKAKDDGMDEGEKDDDGNAEDVTTDVQTAFKTTLANMFKETEDAELLVQDIQDNIPELDVDLLAGFLGELQEQNFLMWDEGEGKVYRV